MGRIAATTPAELKFNQNDTPAIRAQKLEILRLAMVNEEPEPGGELTGPILSVDVGLTVVGSELRLAIDQLPTG